VQSNSLQVHVEAVADGYVLTAHAPCKASMQAALSALLRINPDAYDVCKRAEWVAERMGQPHPDEELAERVKTGGTD
jgi:hypothetical protein